MANTFPLVPLSDVLTQYKKYIDAPEPKIYPKLSVKLYGKGVKLDAPADGTSLKMKRHQIAKSGQVVLSEIWGKKGAIGFVPPEGDGALCTSHFFLFDVNYKKIHPKYLKAIFTANYLESQLNAEAKGTTGYAAVRPNYLLAARIPLPTLSEQRRIVARIEELAAKIEAARELKRQAAAQANLLIAQTISKEVSDEKWKYERLEKILSEPPRNGLAPQEEAESGGRLMLRINAVSSTATRYVDLSAFKMVDVPDEVAKPFILRNEDVFIVRYNGDINRVAKAAIFKSAKPCNIVFPDKLMRLRPDSSKMLPDFLVYALGCRRVRTQVEELGKTTAGQIGVSGSNAKSFEVPLPPISEQHRIVSVLDNLQTKVDRLKNLQAETAAELDALMPAILDKAFKGEL